MREAEIVKTSADCQSRQSCVRRNGFCIESTCADASSPAASATPWPDCAAPAAPSSARARSHESVEHTRHGESEHS
eukprot:1469300-Pleurochrysis_carterae.AAC.1